MQDKIYIAIDLKSFYASVECVQRGLNPLDANLVVADKSRTDKTICLAVSPSLKVYGLSGRSRLFEVVQKVSDINRSRRGNAPGNVFTGKSILASELKADPGLELDYIAAPPQMKLYMTVSNEIYNIYLKYVAPEDIHIYSVDEVFIDATGYLERYNCTARQFAEKLVRAVLKQTGITATAGIGTNLYLCKIAMDIMAKHIEADKDGVRIAYLDEKIYRQKLWNFRPLTAFWRVGAGIAGKLEANGMFTMGDVALTSVTNEDLLYKLFGINAELLIDHAWGYEPCTIADIKSYRPASSGMGLGQVLSEPYNFEKGRIIVREMADSLVFDLTEKELVTDKIVLTVGYDVSSLNTPEKLKMYKGEVKVDFYGRKVPKSAHGTVTLNEKTSSSKLIADAVTKLYDDITDKSLLIRRINITADKVISSDENVKKLNCRQADMFSLISDNSDDSANAEKLEKEQNLQKTIVELKRKYGKNSVLKGMNFLEGATMRMRNGHIGGHKA